MGDVREGGAWSRRQRWKNDALYLAVRALLAVLVPLPVPLLRAVGRAVGLLALVVLPGSRRTAVANLATAFPEASASERARLLARVHLTLGAHLGDALALLEPRRPAALLPIDDADLALLRDPRGVVFASAHLGPWERVASTLVGRGVPMTALARASYDPRLDAVYARLRRGVPVIYRGLPGAAARIVRTLRRGGVLGVPMDLRARVPSVDSPLFGRPAPTAVGPARIALRVGAAVVVGTVAPDARAEGGLRITCTSIATEDLPPESEEAARVLTSRINAALEARIRALPAHWPWMHARFGSPETAAPAALAPPLNDRRATNPVH